MQTVDKAFELLSLFTTWQVQLGLSDIARQSKFDKATARRLLLSLAKHGFIEQDIKSRRYRIGPGVLRLAKLREASVPLDAIVQPILKQLTDDTGETAHFALLAGGTVSTVAVSECSKSNRVSMALGESLPMHATATGLSILSYFDQAARNAIAANFSSKFTPHTPTDDAEISALLKYGRSNGFVVNRGFYEADVCSIASPIFNPSCQPLGAIAVATPISRFTASLEENIRVSVITAAAEITSQVGGQYPEKRIA